MTEVPRWISKHPQPRCRGGRGHTYACFPNIPNHFACTTCGVEDDEGWWVMDEAGNSVYTGPPKPIFADIRHDGWLLREDAPLTSDVLRDRRHRLLAIEEALSP